MADEAQVKLLKEQGVVAWNEWRQRNPETQPDLSAADFDEADLIGADLNGTNLNTSSLIGSKLSGVTLSGANLAWANLFDADLSKAILFGTNLTNAILSGTNFDQCLMDAVQLGDLDLSECKGLETIIHFGPSIIGIDTIYLSRGNIPEEFLRGAGVPEPFITRMKSLVADMSPIHFYSCFISYSSRDDDFAERLHTDLQSRGVRCYFAPEDLKIGDKLRTSFDEAIRVHDKLMVLLSEHSVQSPWVEKEVETAFEKERQQNRMVLFPIRLDDAVMNTDQAWAADIRRTRHIGDFRNWKDHDSYKKAFDRLLRDLKAE